MIIHRLLDWTQSYSTIKTQECLGWGAGQAGGRGEGDVQFAGRRKRNQV